MLTIKTMPMLLKIVGKLDIKPAVEMLKGLDIFEDAKDAKDAMKQLSREKVGILACEILCELTRSSARLPTTSRPSWRLTTIFPSRRRTRKTQPR